MMTTERVVLGPGDGASRWPSMYTVRCSMCGATQNAPGMLDGGGSSHLWELDHVTPSGEARRATA